VVRDYQDAPTIIVDKNKVMQILINLIRNAKYACDESGRSNKQIKVRIGRNGNERIAIKIADNGVGISSENMSRIFTRGFTTRTHGHGFGLHSCLLAAREMGGVLTVHSDGPDLGAIFTLDLPCQPEGNSK
jgi:signal transduction histidine kinase